MIRNRANRVRNSGPSAVAKKEARAAGIIFIVRAGLATRYLSPGEAEATLSHDILRGHIDWDRTADSPVLVVDGRPLSMLDLERMLRTYEGWRVELRIVEPTE